MPERRGAARLISRLRERRGAVLIFVVFVLTVLLGIGIFQAQSSHLEFKAAAHYRRAGTSREAAERGLNQALALLQYDAWGVNESRAFACAEPWGALKDAEGRDFPYQEAALLPSPDGSVAFFFRTRDGYRRILQPVARRRRPLARIGIPRGAERALRAPTFPLAASHPTDAALDVRVAEGGLDWVVNWNPDYKRLGAPDLLLRVSGGRPLEEELKLPALSCAPFHDEFLPGAFDSYDLWQERTQRNHGTFFGRSGGSDARARDGLWSEWEADGVRLRWPGFKAAPEFDYLDTRAVGDPCFKLFRYELVAGPNAGADAFRSFESGVDALSVAGGASALPPEHPSRYLSAAPANLHPRARQARLRFTHPADASEGGYRDTRGGALNLNQVNHDADAERQAGAGPGGAEARLVNEAKWIYLYDGNRRPHARYAVTVAPAGGQPNPNALFTGRDPGAPELAELGGLKRYFEALDRGTDARGALRPTGAEPALTARQAGDPAGAWPARLDAILAEHLGSPDDPARPGSGPFASQAELAMLLRKRGFTEAANPGVEARALRADAAYVAGKLSVHAGEWLLDEHWEDDRLILDRGSGADHGVSLLDEDAPNASGSVATRARLGAILDGLRYVWGPDEAREGAYTGYRLDAREPLPRRREAAWAQAGAAAYLLSASLDPPRVATWSGSSAPGWWWRRDARRDEPLRLNILATKPDRAVAVDPYSWTCIDRVDALQLDYLNAQEAAHAWAPQFNEVGRLAPRKFADLPAATETRVLPPPRTGNFAWDFDGRKTYCFVELVAPVSLPDGPLAQPLLSGSGGLTRNWQLFALEPGERPRTGRRGNNVFELPATRILCISAAADPNDPANTGGDAASADARSDPVGANRIRVFNPARVSLSSTESQARGMDQPGAATFNALSYRWRADQPRALTLRDVAGEGGAGSLRVAGCAASHGRFHPANFILVLFDPAELPARGRDLSSLRLVCMRQGSTNDPIVVDAVDFPSGSRAFEEGREAYDFRINRDGERHWTRARGWAGLADAGAYPPGGALLPHDRLEAYRDRTRGLLGPYESFTGSPAFRFLSRGEGHYYNWCDGLNEHALGHYLPGGERNWAGAATQAFVRSDAEDLCGGRSWSAAEATERAGAGTRLGDDVSLMQHDGELPRVPLGWLGRTGRADRSGAAQPDPDLRTWGDLMALSPLEQRAAAGFLGGRAFGVPIEERFHFLFPADDGVDNDLDGRTDRKTARGRRASTPSGCYAADRRSSARVNVNEVRDPAVFYQLAGAQDPEGRAPYLLPLSARPAPGYLSWTEVAERFTTEALADTPFHALFWREQPAASLAGPASPLRAVQERRARERVDLARGLYAGHASVYAVQVTGQALNPEGEPISETRLRAVVERTPDGQVKILEYGVETTR
ncbi:MAG: hypothetical protein M5U26_19460 [Planctomycetota bacterium]|nr:hypothetical protein [Planctomycetota bacterium]